MAEKRDSKPLPNKVDGATALTAAKALLTHLKKAASEAKGSMPEGLLGDRVSVFVTVHMKKIPGRPQTAPIPIHLPHTLLNPEDGVECCVIVKDPAADFKSKLAASPVPAFTKVIGVSKLRKKFHQYKERLALVGQYDAFFADDRVIRMMPQLLGSVFYERKKQPVPVRLDTGSWAAKLERARDSTYAYIGKGQTVAVRVGLTSMTPAQVAENIAVALPRLVSKLPGGWSNVQSVHLQATGSAALPLYKSLPVPVVVEEGAGSDSEEDDSDFEDEEIDSDEVDGVEGDSGDEEGSEVEETAGQKLVAALPKVPVDKLKKVTDAKKGGEGKAAAAAAPAKKEAAKKEEKAAPAKKAAAAPAKKAAAPPSDDEDEEGSDLEAIDLDGFDWAAAFGGDSDEEEEEEEEVAPKKAGGKGGKPAPAKAAPVKAAPAKAAPAKAAPAKAAPAPVAGTKRKAEPAAAPAPAAKKAKK